MDIKREADGGFVAPFITCGTCKGPITERRPGIVIFSNDSGPEPAEVIHKADCERPDTRSKAWADLDTFILQLVQNSGIDMVKAQADYDHLREFGLTS